MTYFRLKASSTLCLMALLADLEAAFMPRLLARAASKPNNLAIAWYDKSLLVLEPRFLVHWQNRPISTPLAFYFYALSFSLVCIRNRHHPSRCVSHSWCRWSAEARKEDELTYGQLVSVLTHGAAQLIKLGVKKSDRVLLVFPPGIDFYAAFLSCLAAGAVAVPVYPPDPSTIQ